MVQNKLQELNSKQEVSYDKLTQEVLVKNKRKRIMGPFSAIGSLSTVDDLNEEDIFDLLSQVSKGAMVLFNAFKLLRCEDSNMARYDISNMTKTRKETFSRNLKELRKANIVRVALREMVTTEPTRPYKLPKNTYMINPDLLKCWHFEDAAILWRQCKR